MNKIELRNVSLNGVMENADGTLFVFGYVNETDSWSQVLGSSPKFIEKIEPGTFQRALDKGGNVEFLYEHDNKQILADTKSGTLKLKEDERGLYMQAKIVPTTWGKDAFELIKSGVIKNMSFGFRALKHKLTKGANGIYERVVQEIELAEVSAVRRPAYVQSSLAARSIEVIENINLEETEMEISLQDRYKEVVARGQELLKTAQAEKRELNSFEQEEILNLETEMKELRDKIKAEEVRAEVEIAEIKKAEITKDERTFEALVNGEETAETRALQMTSEGAKILPTTISKDIVPKVLSESKLFNRTEQLPNRPGFDEVLIEGFHGSAGFVGEMQNLAANDFTFAKVKLNQKRVGTGVVLSDQSVYASGLPVVEYSKGILTKRMSRTLDYHVLYGKGDPENDFVGVLSGVELSSTVKKITTESSTEITYDHIRNMGLEMPQELQKDAFWLMHPNTFTYLKGLKMDDGYPLLLRDKQLHAKFLMEMELMPIVLDDQMEEIGAGKTPILLGNFKEGYATKIKKELHFQHIWKDKHRRSTRSHLLIVDMYADGKVIRPEAFVKLTMKA